MLKQPTEELTVHCENKCKSTQKSSGSDNKNCEATSKFWFWVSLEYNTDTCILRVCDVYIYIYPHCWTFVKCFPSEPHNSKLILQDYIRVFNVVLCRCISGASWRFWKRMNVANKITTVNDPLQYLLLPNTSIPPTPTVTASQYLFVYFIQMHVCTRIYLYMWAATVT